MNGIQFYGDTTPKKAHRPDTRCDSVLTRSPCTPTGQIQRLRHTRVRTPKSLGRLGDGQKNRTGMQAFLNEQKPQLMSRYPFLSSDQIHKKVVRLWQKMTKDQQESYVTVTSFCTPRRVRLPWTPVRTPGMNWRSKLPGGKKRKFFKSIPEAGQNNGSVSKEVGQIEDTAAHIQTFPAGDGNPVEGLICGPKRADDDSGHDTDTDDSLSAGPSNSAAVLGGGDGHGPGEKDEQVSGSEESFTFQSSLADKVYLPGHRWTFVRTRVPEIVGQVEDKEAGILVRDGKDRRKQSRSVSFSEKAQVVIRTDSESETQTQENKSPEMKTQPAIKDPAVAHCLTAPSDRQTRSQCAKTTKRNFFRSQTQTQGSAQKLKGGVLSANNQVNQENKATSKDGGVFDFDSDTIDSERISYQTFRQQRSSDDNIHAEPQDYSNENDPVLSVTRQQKEDTGHMKVAERASHDTSKRAKYVKLSVATSPVHSSHFKRSRMSASFPDLPNDDLADYKENDDKAKSSQRDGKKMSYKQKRGAKISSDAAENVRRSPRLSGKSEDIQREIPASKKRQKGNLVVEKIDENSKIARDNKIKQTTILHYFTETSAQKEENVANYNLNNQDQEKVSKSYISEKNGKILEDSLKRRKMDKDVKESFQYENRHSVESQERNEDMFQTPVMPAKKISEIVQKPLCTPGGTTILTRSQKKRTESDLSQVTPCMSPSLLKMTMKQASVAPKKRRRTNSAGVIVDVDETNPPKLDVFVDERKSRKWLGADMGEVEVNGSVVISDLSAGSDDEEFTLAPPLSPKKKKMHNVGGNIVQISNTIEEKEKDRHSRKDLEGDLQLSRYEIIDEISASGESVIDTVNIKKKLNVKVPPKAPHKRRRSNSAGNIIDLEGDELPCKNARLGGRRSQKALKSDLDMLMFRKRPGSRAMTGRVTVNKKAQSECLSAADGDETAAKMKYRRKARFHVEDVIQQVVGEGKVDMESLDSQELDTVYDNSQVEINGKLLTKKTLDSDAPKQRYPFRKKKSLMEPVESGSEVDAPLDKESFMVDNKHDKADNCKKYDNSETQNEKASIIPSYCSQGGENDDAMLVHRNEEDIQGEEEHASVEHVVDLKIDRPKLNESFSSTEENEQGLIHRSDEEFYPDSDNNEDNSRDSCGKMNQGSNTETDYITDTSRLSVKERTETKKDKLEADISIGSDMLVRKRRGKRKDAQSKETTDAKLNKRSVKVTGDLITPKDVSCEAMKDALMHTTDVHIESNETEGSLNSKSHVAVNANLLIVHKDVLLDNLHDELGTDGKGKLSTRGRKNLQQNSDEETESYGFESLGPIETKYNDNSGAVFKDQFPEDMGVFSAGDTFNPFQSLEDEVSSPDIFLTQQSAKSSHTLERTLQLLQKIGSPDPCDGMESPLPSADSISTDISGVDLLSSKSSSESPCVGCMSSSCEQHRQEGTPSQEEHFSKVQNMIKSNRRRAGTCGRRHANKLDQGNMLASNKETEGNESDDPDTGLTKHTSWQGGTRKTYMKGASTNSCQETSNFDAVFLSNSSSSEKDVLCNMFDEMTTRSTEKNNNRRVMASSAVETESNFGGMFQDDSIFM